MDQLIAFHRMFGSCVLRPPEKDYFFAVPWGGSFGRILTMQLEPPKLRTHILSFSLFVEGCIHPGRAVAGQLLAVTGQPLSVSHQLFADTSQFCWLTEPTTAVWRLAHLFFLVPPKCGRSEFLPFFC